MSLCYPIFLYMLLIYFPILHCRANNCLTEGSRIINGDIYSNNTLISPGEVFELGFFSPDGNFNKNRYLGIWYYSSNPKILVWVANREKPLLEKNGYLTLKDGDAHVLDTKGSIHWSTNSHNYVAPSNTTKLCLSDQGNLILNDTRKQGNPILWQSFDHPTDTFLPGMILDRILNLTSWQNQSNPSLGTHWLVLQPDKDQQMVASQTGFPNYWASGVTPFAKIPLELTELLANKDRKSSFYYKTRLVMSFTGQVQFWKWESERGGWSLNWWEPKDRCDYYKACGNFGSCNSNNELPCKCLPGFEPSLVPEWNLGCFSGGCVPKSGSPCQRKYSYQDTFFSLPKMKVGETSCSATTDENCETQCLKDCTCVAYAYGVANCKGTGNSTENRCLMWSQELLHLQEEFTQGLTIFVRAPRSDIEPTSRSCKPCGAYPIPYPLSTEPKCGDFSYSNFYCNTATGQVNFTTPSGTFRVTLINPEEANFFIQVRQTNSCDSIESFLLSPKYSLPFQVRNCSVVHDKIFVQVKQPFIEVELGWKLPQEPTCNTALDCHDWPHTTCKPSSGIKRCICASNFHWDGLQLKCTKVHFPLKVVASCIAVVLAVILLCGVCFIYHIRKRRITERKVSDKFEDDGDDTEGLDVPFFDWGSILAATNNFADANRLGTGGFGSVFWGKLSDGKEIAVKRLSSVSMQGVEEFRTEVVLIAKLQHRNLVRLLGYCAKADEKILVYEYMPNGCLDSCLFDKTFSVYLDWKKRFDIIFGIARGLLYLHQDSRLTIIHRDLKPSNILLDEKLNPKISDFGIARIVGGNEMERNTTRVVGTYGYMSPEYAYEGLFSFKSDVFSFGVVLLETISGKRNSRITVFGQGLSLLGHAWRLWSEGRSLDLIDQTLRGSCKSSEVLKCIHVGLLCVQEEPSDRPTMSTVVLMLSSDNASLPLPKKPAFFSRKSSSETATSSSLMGSSSLASDVISMSTEGR